MSDRIDITPYIDRAALAERRVAKLLAVAVEARGMIRLAKLDLYESSRYFGTDEVVDQQALEAIAAYDAVIGRLDDAIAGAMGGA